MGQDFTVTDPSPALPMEAVSLKDALDKAYSNRPDFRPPKRASLRRNSACARRKPSVILLSLPAAFMATTVCVSPVILMVSSMPQVPSTSTSLTAAASSRILLQNNAELTNRHNELENLRGQIDFEVRSALLDLKAAADQVDVAKSNVQLASESLKQSRDRFTAGVTNTVEIVQAQQAVAVADEDLISAQFQYNVAKVSLARAVGLAENAVHSYFAK